MAVIDSIINELKKYYTNKIKSFEETEVKSFGKSQGFLYKEIGDTYLTNLYNKLNYLDKDYTKMTKPERERFNRFLFNNLDMDSKNQQFKSNYADMILKLGEFSGIDNNIAEQIKQSIINMNDKQFINLVHSDKALNAILHYYDTLTDLNDELPNTDEIGNLYDSLFDWLVLDEY